MRSETEHALMPDAVGGPITVRWSPAATGPRCKERGPGNVSTAARSVNLN